MTDHTFVIPAYKNSPYLESCVESLLNQNLKSDITIATSTPTPQSAAIAQKYNIPYIINHQSRGIAGDWNFSMQQATSKYVTIAHQDDLYDPAYTQLIFTALQKNEKEPGLIAFSNYQDLVNDKARAFSLNSIVKTLLLYPFFFSKTIKKSWVKKSILRFGDPICCPTVTLNRQALKDFSFSEDYTCALDWYAWYQIANQKGAFIYINKKLVQHRIHTESETTVQLAMGKRQEEELKMFEMMWGQPVASWISKLYAIGYKDNNL